MENLGLSPLAGWQRAAVLRVPANKDLAYVAARRNRSTWPIGDRVEVNVGRDADITIARHLKDQQTTNIVARQYKRRLDDKYVLYYDLSGLRRDVLPMRRRSSPASRWWRKVELERQLRCQRRAAGERGQTEGLGQQRARGLRGPARGQRPGGAGGPEPREVLPRLCHPAKSSSSDYSSVTYKRRKVGPELNTDKRREPL